MPRFPFALGCGVLFCATTTSLAAQRPSDALAPTPPMGWNSWNKFACNVSEQLIRETADAMVASGMQDAGYRYIVIDDCWQVARDSAGTIVADAERFPSGMKALADYVHAKGLEFGLYSDAGLKTCEGRPGSRGYEYQDARTYADWGVDYLKYDWCHHGTQNAEASYRLMRDALDASGRLITLSICEWGSNKPWLWARDIGHLWRTTGDIKDCWVCERGLSWTSILDRQVGLESYAGPGGWNDPDMLEVGNGGMTLVEYRAHFSLWAILAAPLMAGNDLRSMTPEIRDILTNREVVAVDQDPLGRQGRKVRDDGDVEVWAKELADGSRAVALLNRGESAIAIAVAWPEIGYTEGLRASVRDLWTHRDIGQVRGSYTAEVPAHGVVLVRITP
ncbi:MAG: alpha-galactosidase [Gemmatimonadota bacterium]|nr:alpha-galactosidase [Gemmatimonadota bacterium]MDH4351343.1 alpha-galactosidase [Gemmatimonadota bacterium]MDH5195693.1 alpha-galactosidase [Gemmatimonadota bacterium]